VFEADSVSVGSAGQANIVGQLTVLGRVQPLSLTATLADASAEVSIDRADFGMTWNKLGGIKGPANITVTARFTHQR
jgi:polyisoprenoid-binding protein YceI